MPPKSKGRPTKARDKTNANEEVSVGSSRDDFPERKAAKGRGNAKTSQRSQPANAVPDVFQDMLTETLSSPMVDVEERPRKRRRLRQPGDDLLNRPALSYDVQCGSSDDEDPSIEFEDVFSKQEQRAYNDLDDNSSEDNFTWEEVGINDLALRSSDAEDDGDLHLTLGTGKSQKQSPAATRRKALNKAERALRLDIHKMHILCLLSHIDRRNNWCNDNEVQAALKSLLSKHMMDCLKPKESYTQFGKAESVKKGLLLVIKMWESKYSITAKGMQRSYWAESERDIKDFKLSPDAETVHEKADFRAAAKELKGSRDVGAQLFCALLRSAGLDVRLACSLQPLPFTTTSKAPPLLIVKASPLVAKEPTPELSVDEKSIDVHSKGSPFGTGGPSAPGMPFSPRRRLGHPNAANYFMPLIGSPPSVSPKPKLKQKKIRESLYPVFWIEVLDVAHQKWMPVNPMDDTSVNTPRKFEPPASDPENNMSYVIAFEEDGAARDVTRRYAKSYNAKTRKNRVESTEAGERWWRRTMRFYSRGWKSDLDQIEDTEFAASEAREPMPKSVADFKDHPVYALERHLRRNEALVLGKEVGKVAAGREAGGAKRLESVYRRRDVKPVKSADGWYRIGYEVKVGEQPVKTVSSRKPQADDDEDAEEDRAGTALYTFEQTELYEAPPVVNGRVPKNSYGNLDIYVPSMVPRGGVHIRDPTASHAARLLGLDFADAVTGFSFRGRHGTAILNGVVVAEEYKDALEAVMQGSRDEMEAEEGERRAVRALVAWKKFLVGLRIRERVFGGEGDEEEPDEAGEEDGEQTVMAERPMEEREAGLADNSGMESEEYIDDGEGGGFFLE